MFDDAGFNDIMGKKQLSDRTKQAIQDKNNNVSIPLSAVELDDYYENNHSVRQNDTVYMERVIDHWRQNNQAKVNKPAVFARAGLLFHILAPLTGWRKYSNCKFEPIPDTNDLSIWKPSNKSNTSFKGWRGDSSFKFEPLSDTNDLRVQKSNNGSSKFLADSLKRGHLVQLALTEEVGNIFSTCICQSIYSLSYSSLLN